MEMREGASLAERQWIRRRRQRLVDRQRRQPVALRSLRDELDLPRRRVERERRIGDVRDVLRMDAAGGADPGDGRAAGDGVIEDGVDHALVRLPREEVAEV